MIYHSFNPSFKRFPTWKGARSLLLRSGSGAGKGRRAWNYVSEIWRSASQCEMLIGGDDIRNDVITLWACFHVFFNVCLHSRSFLLRADWWKFDSSVDREPPGHWRRNSYSRDVVASSSSFSHPAARAPWRACSLATYAQFKGVMSRYLLFFLKT